MAVQIYQLSILYTTSLRAPVYYKHRKFGARVVTQALAVGQSATAVKL